MFVGQLRGFQLEAYERMIERRRMLLAYRMGMGKTPITIAVLEHLLDQGLVRSGLIFAPASLKYQWAEQIDKFTGGKAMVIVIDGDPKKREQQYLRAIQGEQDYTILNYEKAIHDWQWVRELPRDFIVCDECTQLKGLKAKRGVRIKRLQADYRFGLSGQPLENLPEEVYSIMQWVDEEVLGRADIFDSTFIVRNPYSGQPLRYKNLPVLHARLTTAMVRKTWDDVPEDERPVVIEPPPVLIEFDLASRRLYRYIVADLQKDLVEAMNSFGDFDVMKHYSPLAVGSGMEMRGQIMAKLTCLRMLCDHPELLRVSADKFDADDIRGGSQYASELKSRGLLEGLGVAPKLREFVAQVKDILSADPRNKVVVFSYFKPTLALMQDAFDEGSVLFTGDMNAKQKDTARIKFQTDPGTRLFLSSDAGGYGVDLPQANFLCNYDLPWSAGKLDQRNARIIRLSTEWPHVTILNYLIAGSIEQRQYAMLRQKGRVASAIIDGEGYDTKGEVTLDLGTLSDFLEQSLEMV